MQNYVLLSKLKMFWKNALYLHPQLQKSCCCAPRVKPSDALPRFGGGRPRPYGGGPPGRGGGGSDPRDFDRYPYPPLPPVPAYDRYDPYYRYYMEREAYYARMERGYPSRERGYPPIPPRDRLAERYPPDPRDRLMPPPPRSYLEDRARGLPEPYFRERDPLAARPPPEYYDRYVDFFR